MSSFICSDATIGTIANQLATDVIDKYDLAESMVRLNVHSVAYRYDLTDGGASKRFTGSTIPQLVERCMKASDTPVEVTADRLLGAISCFLYNAGDHDEADEDKTYQRVGNFAASLAEKGIVSEGWEL